MPSYDHKRAISAWFTSMGIAKRFGLDEQRHKLLADALALRLSALFRLPASGHVVASGRQNPAPTSPRVALQPYVWTQGGSDADLCVDLVRGDIYDRKRPSAPIFYDVRFTKPALKKRTGDEGSTGPETRAAVSSEPLPKPSRDGTAQHW
ncbi:MAG: hypothetical protein J0H99_01890, partial [Rhodospirillales bacterium]|nr:hypothetical protein [Rhodospirillales bacterium]